MAALLSCASVLALAVSAGATQFVASRLGYHPALGTPWFTGVPWLEMVYAPWSYWSWRTAPWAVNAQQTFNYVQMAFSAGGVASMLLLLHAMGKAQRPKPKANEGVHGTAKFGDMETLREAGLLPPKPDDPWKGIYCGAWEDKTGTLHYLRDNSPSHALVLGPLRSGKLVSIVIPTATTWDEPMVVYDEKGEIGESTEGWRATECGQTVLRFEPGASDNEVCWNPLDMVRLETEFEYRDVATIMEMVADPDGKGLEGHFDPEGASTLIGVTLHACYVNRALGKTCGLGDVLKLLSDRNGRDGLYGDMRDNRHLRGRPHPLIASVGQDLLDKDVRERSGVHSTAKRMLRLFRDPIVVCNTSRSDFTIDELMNSPVKKTLYVVTRGDDKLRMRPLVRLFFTLLFGRLTSAEMLYVEGKPVSPHKHRLLVLIDEFASLRRMEIVQEAMSKCAGYGIKVFLLCQDREQIIAEYGPHETITSHCQVKVAFAPSNIKTAEWLSELSGRATLITEDVSESGSAGSGKKSWSRSYHTVSRQLMTPDEVSRLKAPKKDSSGMIVEPGEILVHVVGYPIVKATQSLYFQDPEFCRRVAIPAPKHARKTSP
jgi:type IV secretion system protein VirD4